MKLSTQPTRALVQSRRSYGAARVLIVALAACAALTIAPCLPSALAAATPTFTQTNLVSDVPGMAKTTDPNLVNPWGMALGLNSGLWISDNGSGEATTYDGTGQSLGSPVIMSASDHDPDSPTGVVTNATMGFVISEAGKSGPSSEIFATENGTIQGWNSSVDPSHAVIAVNNSTNAV